MPISASAKKSLRQSQTRRVKNVKEKTVLRKTIKNYKALDKEGAAKQLPAIYKVIDKAAKANLIKKNTANRTKSRLSKRLK